MFFVLFFKQGLSHLAQLSGTLSLEKAFAGAPTGLTTSGQKTKEEGPRKNVTQDVFLQAGKSNFIN